MAPVVVLSGSTGMTINVNTIFTEPGAHWTDDVDGSGSLFTGTW